MKCSKNDSAKISWRVKQILKNPSFEKLGISSVKSQCQLSWSTSFFTARQESMKSSFIVQLWRRSFEWMTSMQTWLRVWNIFVFMMLVPQMKTCLSGSDNTCYQLWHHFKRSPSISTRAKLQERGSSYLWKIFMNLCEEEFLTSESLKKTTSCMYRNSYWKYSR